MYHLFDKWSTFTKCIGIRYRNVNINDLMHSNAYLGIVSLTHVSLYTHVQTLFDLSLSLSYTVVHLYEHFKGFIFK